LTNGTFSGEITAKKKTIYEYRAHDILVLHTRRARTTVIYYKNGAAVISYNVYCVHNNTHTYRTLLIRRHYVVLRFSLCARALFLHSRISYYVCPVRVSHVHRNMTKSRCARHLCPAEIRQTR